MPFCRPQMSDSLNVMLVLRFERIWIMSKHITQKKHATTNMENHTLRPSCILCNGGHAVTHQTVLALLSSFALSTSSVILQPVWWWAESAPLITSAQHTSSSTRKKLLVVTITTKGMYYWKQDLSYSSLFFLNYVHIFSTWKIWHSEIVMVLTPKL